METEVHFRETQTFDQFWLWGLLALSALAALANLLRGKRSVRGTVGRLATLGGVALLFRVAALRTEVRDDGVYVQFAPFHRSSKRVPFSELADVQAAGYSPLRYGGWGIRWSPSGVAYTVSGKTGVRLKRAGGKSTFVGSDRPDKLVAAVQKASEREV
ncbi:MULTISPECIES: hypothetical protein [Halorussus]|uniref:hypothetical protein n=1 Tax=Halorussus TaxID=1070314 RepID=UPI000E217665|nr:MULTISPECIES: hypothetical protein [Halorussus]NHN59252.1 hypothetical protein [Halorussus sp. JP-T4]